MGKKAKEVLERARHRNIEELLKAKEKTTFRKKETEQKVLKFVVVLRGSKADIERVINKFFAISEQEEIVIFLAKESD